MASAIFDFALVWDQTEIEVKHDNRQKSPETGDTTKRCYRESLQELPCVIKYNQLYCTSPGSSYPATSIKHFVEDNRALLRSARHWLLRVT